MLVTIIAIIGLCIPTAALLAQDGSSTEWGTPIRFEDFRATPDARDSAAASISVTILLGYSARPGGNLSFKVAAVMDKNESWMKEEFRSTKILYHEQGHFDIAHMYARKLDAHLRKTTFTRKDLPRLHQVYDAFLQQMNEVQVRYDRETAGGLDDAKQAEWEIFISNQLDEVE